ncbi:MAG: hypothetical protein NT151_10290 [Acidobacteria bacterium]|nr:hypothetical protein [Acidobacteriota bacterium]
MLVLVVLAYHATPLYAGEPAPLGSASAVFLVGGQWGTPTGLSGSVGFLFGPTFPAKAGADPTSGRKGLILVGTGGVGGLSIAVGGAALAREGRLLTTGFDGLLRVTRTTSNPTNATADATYAGVEAGLVLMGARLSAGVSHRIAGSSGSKDTIFTFGVGVQIPFGW